MTLALASNRQSLRPVLIGIGFLILVMFLLGMRNIVISRESDSTIERLYANELLTISHVKDADSRLIDIEQNLQRLIILKTPEGRSAAKNGILKDQEILREEIDAASKGITSYENIRRLSRFETAYSEYRKNVNHALTLSENLNVKGDQLVDYMLSEDFQKALRSSDRLLDEIAASKEYAALESLKEAETLNAQGRWSSMILLIATLLAGVASLFYLKSAFLRPMGELKTALEGLATGNLDLTVPLSEQPNHVGELARAIKRAQTRLQGQDLRLRAQARISQAVPEDVEPVLQLILHNAMDGPFDPSALTPGRQEEMRHDFTQALSTGVAERTTWEHKLEVVPQDLWVYKIDGKVAAFALVLGLSSQKSLERELHAIAVHPSHHGQGIGSQMLDFFCRHFAGRVLHLQTRSGSRMMRMASSRGFATYHKIGAELFMKRPADFGAHALTH